MQIKIIYHSLFLFVVIFSRELIITIFQKKKLIITNNKKNTPIMKIKDFKVKRKRTVHVSFGPIRKIKKLYI